MKVTQQKPPEQFWPVIITLETQEEVDRFFALLNHRSVAKAVELELGYSEQLEPFCSKGYKTHTANLQHLLETYGNKTQPNNETK